MDTNTWNIWNRFIFEMNTDRQPQTNIYDKYIFLKLHVAYALAHTHTSYNITYFCYAFQQRMYIVAAKKLSIYSE